MFFKYSQDTWGGVFKDELYTLIMKQQYEAQSFAYASTQSDLVWLTHLGPSLMKFSLHESVGSTHIIALSP